MSESILMSYTGKLSREQLAVVPTPTATATHKPIPHVEVVNSLIETLGFRHISVVKDEYAVSKDGMRMFGVMEIDQGMHGARFALGIRNSHDKSFRLAITVGYRVFVCENLAFSGDFSPVLAKHSKHFSLANALSVGVDNMQRNFKPMVEAVDHWRDSQLSDVAARLIIYRAFIEAELDVPRHLAHSVHGLYFDPQHEEFAPRTMWSLSNSFTSAFKELDPIPQYKATGKARRFPSDGSLMKLFPGSFESKALHNAGLLSLALYFQKIMSGAYQTRRKVMLTPAIGLLTWAIMSLSHNQYDWSSCSRFMCDAFGDFTSGIQMYRLAQSTTNRIKRL